MYYFQTMVANFSKMAERFLILLVSLGSLALISSQDLSTDQSFIQAGYQISTSNT